MIERREDKPLFAIAIILVAYFCFAFVDTSAKYLTLLALPALQIVFMRYFGQLMANVIQILLQGNFRESLFCSHKKQLIIRGAFLVFSTICNFISLKYLPLTLVATILFLAPILVCAFSTILLNEKVGVWRWSAILFAFIGIVVIIRPFDASFHPATLLSLLTAALFALYSIWTRKLSGKCSNDSMQLYTGLTGTVLLIYFGIHEWQSPTEFFDWSILLIIGVIAWIGHIILTKAHLYASPQIIMPFGYVYIIYISVLDYFIFDHIADIYTLIGALMIMASGLFIIYREYKLQKLKKGIAP